MREWIEDQLNRFLDWWDELSDSDSIRITLIHILLLPLVFLAIGLLNLFYWFDNK